MNNMKVEFEALPENEGFARVAVAAFLTAIKSDTGRDRGRQNCRFGGSYKRSHPRI